MIWALAFGIFVLTCHDCTFTRRRIQKYGRDVEFSWLVYNLMPFAGLEVAMALGMVIPTIVIVGVFLTFGWKTILAIWFGAKILNTRYQYLSLVVEAEIDRLRGSGTVTSSSPSDASHPGVDR